MRPDFDVAVVGAGVIGLAVAASLARRGRSVVVLERNDGIAREITARNSEVVHAGLYYPSDSLKAELCCRGREALYERCAALGIPHRRLGKLIVASRHSELGLLEEILARGRANGVPGLEMIEAHQVQSMEPQVRAVAALLSPETGIVDAHAFALSFLAEAESHGAVLALRTEVVGIEQRPGGWRVMALVPSGERQGFECGAVVNAAGLAGDRIATLAGMDVDACDYRLHFCKGDYFSLAPGAPISLSHLVYPVPVAAGLGIHATLDLGGRTRFGPDTEYVDEIGYPVDPAKAELFADAIRSYLPELETRWLSPDYAGVRPKLAGAGESFRDFVVAEESEAGLPGLVNCIGIESPGLTSAPAIGERVAELLASL